MRSKLKGVLSRVNAIVARVDSARQSSMVNVAEIIWTIRKQRQAGIPSKWDAFTDDDLRTMGEGRGVEALFARRRLRSRQWRAKRQGEASHA
jgi:hypothetical protein